MIKFRNLFSFHQKEIQQAFKNARLLSQIRGLKLLCAPLQTNSDQSPNQIISGKLLVITPRKSGKAHDRNLIRRRVKAIFFEEELYKSNSTFILLVYKEAQALDFEDIKSFLISSIKIK